MKKRGNLIALIGIILVISLVAGLVEVNTAFLKVSIKENQNISKSFSLFSEKGGAVSLEVVNLKGVSLQENSLILNAGESKIINAFFNSKNLTPGISMGYVKIDSAKDSFNMPVIMEVESKDLFFDGDLEIPPIYSKISSGDKLVVNLKIFDLTFGTEGLGSTSVNVDYIFYQDTGVVVASEQETIVVNHDISITKTISLPKNLKPGNYFAGVIIKYGNSIGTSSGLFEVSSNPTFGGLEFKFSAIWWFVFGIIFLIILGIFFVYLLRDRDKFILELKKYNNEEVEQQRRFLLEQQKVLMSNKKIPIEEVKREIIEKTKELERVHYNRIKELSKIKHSKSKNSRAEMNKKISEWKSKGYNTLLLESKLKGINKQDMSKIVKNLKKKGYK